MFRIDGTTDDGRQASISWFPLGPKRVRARLPNRRGLDRDEELIRRAIEDELDGRTFRATPTGPFFRADLDDPRATLVHLTSYFLDRYSVDGDPPKIDASVPAGAIP